MSLSDNSRILFCWSFALFANGKLNICPLNSCSWEDYCQVKLNISMTLKPYFLRKKGKVRKRFFKNHRQETKCSWEIKQKTKDNTKSQFKTIINTSNAVAVSGHYRQTWTWNKGTEKSCPSVPRCVCCCCCHNPGCASREGRGHWECKAPAGVGGTGVFSAPHPEPSPPPSLLPIILHSSWKPQGLFLGRSVSARLGKLCRNCWEIQEGTKASCHKEPFHLGRVSIKHVLVMCIRFIKWL